MSEKAARMRVDRALERLHTLLRRRGISSTASGLTAALAVGASSTAPGALAASSITTAVAVAAFGATASTSFTFFTLMHATKLKSALVGALLVAAVATSIWQETRVRRLAAENADLRVRAEQVAALRTRLADLAQVEVDAGELARLRDEQAKAKEETARLRGMAGLARRAENDAAQLRQELSRLRAAASTNQVGGGMGDLMTSAFAEQTKGRLTRMQTRLNLTPAQAEAIRGILDRQSRQMSKSMSKVFAGKLGQDDMAELRKEAFDPESEIKAQLTPEQLELYKEYKLEESVGQARLAANTELIQMQTSLGLSTEQQDQAFGILYDTTLRQLMGEATLPKTSNPADAMQAVVEQKVKALEGVLRPEQLQAYRDMQETQLRFIRNLLPGETPKTGGD